MRFSNIEHVFVLVLENRSFDHVFGHRANADARGSARGQAVDGVDPGRSNSDGAGRAYAQWPMAGYDTICFRPDPPHEAEDVAAQIGGGAMDGFVRAYERAHPGLTPSDYAKVMQYLSRGHMPVSNFLADRFAISDRWFTPIPSATIPNRLYAMCGHSLGERDSPTPQEFITGYDIHDSVFQHLRRARLDFRVYTGTVPPWASLVAPLRLELFGRPDAMRSIKHLAPDLAALTSESAKSFPQLVWLEPSYGWTDVPVLDLFYADPNCDHPPVDVRRGQALIESIYDALRTSAIWESSALVIFYDEHGGFYDHVPPPACEPGRDGFGTRGPRVPALVVSPFVKPGSVVRPEPGQCFDHTSVLKFLRERFDLPMHSPRLDDPSTASLGVFFDSAQRTLAPATGLGLSADESFSLHRKLGLPVSSGSREALGMRMLGLAMATDIGRFALEQFKE